MIKKKGYHMRKKATNKQKAYINEYNKENYRRFTVKLHKTLEPEMIAFLETKENVNAYLKDLIKREMEK